MLDKGALGSSVALGPQEAEGVGGEGPRPSIHLPAANGLAARGEVPGDGGEQRSEARLTGDAQREHGQVPDPLVGGLQVGQHHRLQGREIERRAQRFRGAPELGEGEQAGRLLVDVLRGVQGGKQGGVDLAVDHGRTGPPWG